MNLLPERGSVTRSGFDHSSVLRLTEPRSNHLIRFTVPMRVHSWKSKLPVNLAWERRHLAGEWDYPFRSTPAGHRRAGALWRAVESQRSQVQDLDA